MITVPASLRRGSESIYLTTLLEFGVSLADAVLQIFRTGEDGTSFIRLQHRAQGLPTSQLGNRFTEVALADLIKVPTSPWTRTSFPVLLEWLIFFFFLLRYGVQGRDIK